MAFISSHVNWAATTNVLNSKETFCGVENLNVKLSSPTSLQPSKKESNGARVKRYTEYMKKKITE